MVGRTSRLNRFLSMPRYAGALRILISRGNGAVCAAGQAGGARISGAPPSLGCHGGHECGRRLPPAV